MNVLNANDESLVRFYENVRREVQADSKSGGQFRFMGETAKQYAEGIRGEMDRRRLQFTPIDWPR
jgi:hypothetical protein